MTERKLDIFAAMSAVDKRNGNWFTEQPEDVRKELSPPVFLRWAATINDGKYSGDVICAVNEYVNVNMWDVVEEHPELFFKLTAMCGVGTNQKHIWIGMPKRIVNNKAKDLISRFYPSINDSEIDMILRMHTRESFVDFVNGTAIPQDEAKEVIKAYDKLNDSKETKRQTEKTA